ncbi:MAG: membrane lipoprotein lipid attachment site-containing protein [Campylobacteraceae bacterium]|nr:membrane lipoprotein lipid attachment site-containing protein [Campylobacteraceae bacterium]
MKKIIFYLSIILLLTACSNKNNLVKNELDKNSKELANLIINSSRYIDKQEAKEFSKSIILYSSFLAKKYEVNTHPLIHNTLINLNLKEKGLCYHYANDLLKYINYKNFKSFNFKKIISKRNEYFEHTALILTRKDISFENSIVLDAWRNAGKLYFSKVKNDKQYKWELK